MTTAFIGKDVSVAVRARVALVSRQGHASLGSLAARSGHELLECNDWAELETMLLQQAIDFVLFDAESAGEMPSDLPVPAMQLSDRPSGKSPCLGSIGPSLLDAVADPLFTVVAELARARARCQELEALVQGIRTGSALVGVTPALRRLQSAISRAADVDATVLIEGPRGAGKSLTARMIHCKSRRGARQLEILACADANAESLSRLLQATTGSTLVLEDIERLPAASQAVLVRHLKERTAQRDGVAPRVVATTSAHLPELVARGAFREDLYYRLHALPIVVPSLRERPDDIPLIADAILAHAAATTGRPRVVLTTAARDLLESMHWPCNVSQLEATIQRAQLLAGGASIDREHLLSGANIAVQQATVAAANPAAIRADNEIGEASIRAFEEEEQEILSRALRATKGNVRRAAQLLGIGRATLYRKIQQYGLRMQ